MWIVVAFAAGGVIGMMVHSAWPIPLHAFLAWGYGFSTSAGLGGVAALVAAVIAYRGVSRSADTSRRTALEASNMARDTALEAQWWENARWAVDRLLSGSEVSEDAGNDSFELDVDVIDANTRLLVDEDAYAAIIMLDYLGENAPSEKARSFALDALGTVLGVPSEIDNVDSDSASNVANRQSNRTTRG
ncbi:hypothetical protein [Citricoccus sp. I39-566]|uniref:hypothetical protein n=1 Tax=Citricoccus sp. I39-566 TaxID=3073268 RepID=UPI00286D2F73|nr:hypothetical protein [Citricoccus sp. I39-566]WMY78493.1 hypothetical protein RE421_01125 [Citricoccus sp. I39-566]